MSLTKSDATATLARLLPRHSFVFLIDRHRSRSATTRIVSMKAVTASRTIVTLDPYIRAIFGLAYDDLHRGLVFRGATTPAIVINCLSRELHGGQTPQLGKEWL